MSHYYGSIEGNAKSPATRIGTKSSGISSHVRGWEHGVLVTAEAVKIDGKDATIYEIFRTLGSNNPSPAGIINTIIFDDAGKIISKS